jgi:hypothetical protein
MSLNIPSGMFNKYYEACDEFINNNFIGRSCTLVYPPINVACDHNLNPEGFTAGNVYEHGGPAPFNFGICPDCGGSGYKQQSSTGTIRLRIYWSPKDWRRIAGNLVVPDAEAQVIGFTSDLANLQKAQYVLLIGEQLNIEIRMQLAGEPFLHGFGKNRYFVAYLKRA